MEFGCGMDLCVGEEESRLEAMTLSGVRGGGGLSTVMGLFGEKHCIQYSHENGSSAMMKNGFHKCSAHLSGWGACLPSPEQQRLVGSGGVAVVEGEDGESRLAEMMAAVKLVLRGLGEDPEREGLFKTPLRVAQAFLSATRGYRQSAEDIIGGALFSEAGADGGAGCGGGSGGMVVVQNIDLFASCEACLLPFRVRCHMAYVPSGERVVGLSKVPRVAEMFAKRLQTPQRYAEEVVDAFVDILKPLGVAVVVESWHPQWPLLSNGGVMEPLGADKMVWVPCTVHAARGQLQVGGHMWAEFSAMLDPGLVLDEGRKRCPFHSVVGEWGGGMGDLETGFESVFNGEANGFGQRVFLPLGLLNKPTSPSFAEMVVAVETLLHAVGEDPTREGLQHTPARFVWCLLTSTQGNIASQGMNGNGNGLTNGYANGCHVPEFESGAMTVDCASGSILLQQELLFFSQCEHHLLPFAGVVHVGYFLGNGCRQVSRSTLQKIITVYSQRLQVQERLTRQIAESVGAYCGSSGIIVKVEASHMCMVSRGIEKIGSITATVATLGHFVNDPVARLAFLCKVRKAAPGKE